MVEYHKWKFKSKTYTAFTGGKKCPVLMTRVEYGFLVLIIKIRSLRSRPSIWVVTV